MHFCYQGLYGFLGSGGVNRQFTQGISNLNGLYSNYDDYNDYDDYD